MLSYLSLIVILIQIFGFINFFMSVASWASIQKHIIFEFDGTASLNTFLVLHWCILIILELATVFLSSNEKMGDIKHPVTILFLFVSLYIFYSPFFSFSWSKKCQVIANDFINKSLQHNLPEKATKYLNEGQCPTSQECQGVIENYMQINCFRYPNHMKVLSYISLCVSLLVVASIIFLKRHEKAQEGSRASESAYNSSLK